MRMLQGKGAECGCSQKLPGHHHIISHCFLRKGYTCYKHCSRRERARQNPAKSITSRSQLHSCPSLSRSLSRAFPSSFRPVPSAPTPQNASLSESYTAISALRIRETCGSNLDEFSVSSCQQLCFQIGMLSKLQLKGDVHLKHVRSS